MALNIFLGLNANILNFQFGNKILAFKQDQKFPFAMLNNWSYKSQKSGAYNTKKAFKKLNVGCLINNFGILNAL